jgi:superfamily II DNA or RNA helicase
MNVNSKGFVIKKNSLTDERLLKIKNELTVSPELQNYGNAFQNEKNKFKVYRESSTIIRVPRFYGLTNIDNNTSTTFNTPCNIDLEFNGTLNTKINQPDAAEKTISHLKKNGGGVLSLPTGYGKTTVSLYVLSKIGVRTIIIVHKEFLMNQWVERIKQFLPDATIGYIQGSKIDVVGKDIVIGMLQSLSMKDYEKEIFNDFGLTIIDETHHVCAKVFSKSLFKISTKYMLGLSATPFRKDGLTKVLNWFIGDIFYHVEREQQKCVEVNVIKINKEEYKDLIFPTNRLGKASIPVGINILCEDVTRTSKIVGLALSILRQNNTRNILILSDRRVHCATLKTEIEKQLKEHNLNLNVGLYLGGMKQTELKKSEECEVIIGTYSLAHEGLDIPKLDTLIMSTPKSDIVQSVGRILRETVGKTNNPVIFDIVDEWAVFEIQFYKRLKFYKKTGFKIKYDTALIS